MTSRDIRAKMAADFDICNRAVIATQQQKPISDDDQKDVVVMKGTAYGGGGGVAGRTILFVVHPIDGTVKTLEQVVGHVKSDIIVYGLQMTSETPLTSIEDIARHYLQVSLSLVC